jgi:endoglucanase
MLRRYLLTALLLVASLTPSYSADLAPLQVQGSQLIANGQPIRLRGIDWGWWHLGSTRYSESDMQDQAQWGANAARLAFSFPDLEDPAHPGVWNTVGFREMDDVVKWGAKYHVYIILDMHETPGGQNGSLYDDGGGNRLWNDPACQADFIALWQEIARRYRDDPTIAAYELMNEPDTGQAPANALAKLCRKAIDAIRTIDPNKIIVVTGNHKGVHPLSPTISISRGPTFCTRCISTMAAARPGCAT